MDTKQRYKSMYARLAWDIPEGFLENFKDIDRLRMLNKIIGRTNVRSHFKDNMQYIIFISRFYYDSNFIKQYNIYKETRNKFDMPSLDHIKPLSQGGTWEQENLRIISWFENNAKNNLTESEFKIRIKQYLK